MKLVKDQYEYRPHLLFLSSDVEHDMAPLALWHSSGWRTQYAKCAGCDQVQSSKNRKRLMEEATEMVRRRQREEATLIQQKQEEEALDELMDEHIDCAECHPWIHLPLREPRLCREHSQLAQKKETSQQHPIVCHSFTVEAEVL